MTSRIRSSAISALVVVLAALGLGALALTSAVAREDLRIDRALVPHRFHLATVASIDLTHAAQAAVGVGVLLLGVIVLVMRRRRWDAARLAAMAGAAWVIAEAIKVIIGRPRPPASLWLMAPDPTGSFPSGHETTAVVFVVVAAMMLAGTGVLRIAGTTLAAGFAVAVGLSRVYLGDHYPTDIVGSWLVVAGAVLAVLAVTSVPQVRRLAARMLREPGSVPPVQASSPPLPRPAGRR